jgi:hypothetical protein
MSRISSRVQSPQSSEIVLADVVILLAVPFSVVPVAIWTFFCGVVVELPFASAFTEQDTESIVAPAGICDVSNL